MTKKILTLTFMLCGVAAGAAAQTQPIYLDESQGMEERVEDALKRMTLDEKIAVIHAQSKFSSAGVKRLGFPDLWTDDGPHGVRPDVLWDEWEQAGQTNDSCVAFPALTCLAATWNPSLARLYGESLGEEALYRNKHVILGPGVNIYRTPLNGRNFEYMGEDPWLASRMVVPYIQGLQSKGVAACVKHYALNNDEDYRHQVNVIVSDRALREIYLPAFEAAVKEGKTWAIMGAYNLYKNQHNCHNNILLNKILKQEWGFDGVVISDWGGAHNTEEAITNGLDLEFGTWTDGLTMGATNAYDNYYLANAYKRLIQEGKYTTRELDEKVRRVLRLMFRTNMNRQRPYGAMCSEAHYATAREVAQEGIVLLKNSLLSSSERRVLPIPADARILVVGENAIKMMTVGGGSSSLKVQREVLPLDGMRERFAHVDYARGYVGDTVQSYNGVTVGRSLYDLRSPEDLIAEALEKAKSADYVVVFGGLNKADYQDCEGHDRKEYGLPYGQDALVEALVKTGKRVVFVNISGNAVAMPWLDRVDAVVQGWFIGSESGHALADVLSGDVNPSGKLPYTWYQRLEDTGAHALGAYPGVWRAGHQVIDEEYKEGIFVGYRWAELKRIRPLFAFGYGLSYSSFALEEATADKKEMHDGERISFTVTVRNTGSRAGAETVQLYVTDKKCSLPRPVKELKAFQKVFLQPGESKAVVLTLDKRSLSFFDDRIQQWSAETGEFEARIGFSSDNIIKKLSFRFIKD
ncbi:MAG: glycoside hydrolase family 3 C-terminal domain-containing protein [Prevotella sp.]|nr:glycoside hydrolase family 3 C-terminal domain-containing protein [Prevotella sp.]